MNEKEILKYLPGIFEENFPSGGEISVFFAPGRINLIGEHIDYNGGHVLPCALSLGTYAAVKKRNDKLVRLYSANLSDAGVCGFELTEAENGRLPRAASGSWGMYVAGVLCSLADRGIYLSCGFDMAVYGNLPSGAGLSSSASLEVLTAYMLRSLYGFELENREIALLGQRAENEYCGMHCGIMDQFAVAMAKEGSALYLNTKTLDYEHVPLELNGAVLVIANSNVKHALAGSAYNDRRSECEFALDILRLAMDADRLASGREGCGLSPEFLCDITPAEFERYKDAIEDPVLLRRARHAVFENERTKQAAAALKEGDLVRFGKLMCEAHISISRDFEVSVAELDILQEEALKVSGVYGSRMSGGGFGGCTVSVVKEEAADEFIHNVGAAYSKRTGRTADFYIASPSGGPEKIIL